MPDWAQHVRPRLSSLRLSPTRENEIVDELSQHLDDRWRELIAGGALPDEAARMALADFREGNLLAQYMAPLRQVHAPTPITPGIPLDSCPAISGETCAMPRGCCASSRALRLRSS
jgi:putative ABC transport system permease protein